LLQRNFRYRKLRRTKHKTAEQTEVNAARHLQQRVELRYWFQSTQPASETDASVPARNCNRIEKGAIADKVEDHVHLLCFQQTLGELRAFKLRSPGSELEKLLEAGWITRGRDHIQPCVRGDIQSCLPEGGSRATKKKGLPFFDLQIAIEAS